MTLAELYEVREMTEVMAWWTEHLKALESSIFLKVPRLSALPKSKAVSSLVESQAIKVADAKKKIEQLYKKREEAKKRLEEKIEAEL